VTGGELWSSNGGAGGSGGGGASGATGGAGTAGGATSYTGATCGPGVGTACTEWAPRWPDTTTCCIPNETSGSYASTGGTGGQGGSGGNGAGGNGGDSYAYYQGGGAAVTVGSTVNVTTIGSAGAAGGGPVPGSAGYAGEYNTAD
jgi:hypothetical protein